MRAWRLYASLLVSLLANNPTMEKARQQTTDRVFMVRPCRFLANPETLGDNHFQVAERGTDDANESAQREFDGFVELLRSHGVEVIVAEDTPEPHTPDSIFPNNWFLTDDEGNLTIFKMYAPSRDAESHKEALYNRLVEAYQPRVIWDMRPISEEMGEVLEGTGTMIIDRPNRMIYACRSQRLSEPLLDILCQRYGYSSVIFDALDKEGMPIYHTNVMMALATDLAVICLASVPEDQQDYVISALRSSGHEICDISMEQVYHFAGNMLSVRNHQGEQFMVMSQRALASLTDEQRAMIEKSMTIIAPSLTTIEDLGGGSARCMMGELYRYE